MKITYPELEISPDRGFAPEIDIFTRKDFGERLANLIEKSDDNPVIALNAGWGEGKSTFIKMWRGHTTNHRENKIKSIYFDAFENDYQKDPFLTLASEIYQLIPETDKQKQKNFREKASKALKSITRGIVKVAAKAGTAGIIDGSDIDSAENFMSDLRSKEIDHIVDEKLENAKKDKLNLNKFKEYLTEFSEEAGEGAPLVFIIDELDRCRPDFALELLEQIKHLFSVKGITFLLVTNRLQLENSIRAKYGSEINATNYLHKFIHLWIELPRPSNEYKDLGSIFFKHALNKMSEDGEKILNTDTVQILLSLIKYYQPSFREIERTLTYFAIIMNMSEQKRYVSFVQITVAIVCYFFANQPNILKPIDGELSYDQIIKASRLDKADPRTDPSYLENVKNTIKYDLADADTQKEMSKKNSFFIDNFGRPHISMIKEIKTWLSEINID
ncbi:hypothetical protein J4E05_05805 [Thalassospira sp. NFXS8]|uniref:KAP family P-loop NTPase fold protein n=1 Tax=Thalassospira sp. NFXS8 TaxID=2819093 RepID=UPI0032DF80CC